jgi:hypothetical protein
MSSGALVQSSSVPVVLVCVVLVVTRSSDSVPASSRLEAGLGLRVVDVDGVCCKPIGWCGVVAILWHSLQA